MLSGRRMRGDEEGPCAVGKRQRLGQGQGAIVVVAKGLVQVLVLVLIVVVIVVLSLGDGRGVVILGGVGRGKVAPVELGLFRGRAFHLEGCRRCLARNGMDVKRLMVRLEGGKEGEVGIAGQCLRLIQGIKLLQVCRQRARHADHADSMETSMHRWMVPWTSSGGHE